MKIDTTDCIHDSDDEHAVCIHDQGNGMPYCQECGVEIEALECDQEPSPLDGPMSPISKDASDMPVVLLEVNGLVLEVPAGGTPVYIGSSRDADLRITGDPWMQPKHVRVYLDSHGLHIEDIDSGHGHYIKGGIEDPFLCGGSVLIGTTFIEVR